MMPCSDSLRDESTIATLWGEATSMRTRSDPTKGRRHALAAALSIRSERSIDYGHVPRSVVTGPAMTSIGVVFFPVSVLDTTEMVRTAVAAQLPNPDNDFPIDTTSSDEHAEAGAGEPVLASGPRSVLQDEWLAIRYPDHRSGIEASLDQALISDPSFFVNDPRRPSQFTGILVSSLPSVLTPAKH